MYLSTHTLHIRSMTTRNHMCCALIWRTLVRMTVVRTYCHVHREREPTHTNAFVCIYI